jgi:integrase
LKIPMELVVTLVSWRSRCPESLHGLVFPNQGGDPMRRETVLDHLHATQKKAGIPKRDVKAFRHTFASTMIAAGKPSTEIAFALGHRDSTVTLSIYSHWFRAQKSEGARALATEILAPTTSADDRGDVVETSEISERTLH